MAGNSENCGVKVGILTWLGGMLTRFAARQDLRVRYAIAKAAARARTKQSKPRAE
jgi:hypothetical protein